jgi:hypothetical protein
VRNKPTSLVFIVLLAVLVPLEVLCAQLAYQTLGEVIRAVYLMAIIGLNALWVVVAWHKPGVATLGAIVLAVGIIPYQLWLGQRLLRVQAETTRIVAYAYEQRAQVGAYPTDLTSYTFHDSAMRTYIQAYQHDATQDRFVVYYRVGTDNTSHWYSSHTGWGYYPD